MLSIIFAFMAGVLFGGFCVYSSYHKKWQDALKTLQDIKVENIKHRAMIDTIRQIYGIKEETNGIENHRN
jgi:hypothetical protein